MFTLRFPVAATNIFFLRSFISSFSRAWNPYFFRFIIGSRLRKFTILNHLTFYFMLKRSFFFLEALIVRGAKGFILNEFSSLSYSKSFLGLIFNHWTPGILTNLKVLRRIIRINGLRLLFPFFLMVIGARLQNISLVMEAKRLRLPTIVFLNAYFGHWIVDYPILGNVNRRVADYYTYLFEEMRILIKSFFLHRYAVRRAKPVYTRLYFSTAAMKRDSILPPPLVRFAKFNRSGSHILFPFIAKPKRRRRTQFLFSNRKIPFRYKRTTKGGPYYKKSEVYKPVKWLGSKI